MWKFRNRGKAILKLNEIGHNQSLDYENIERLLSAQNGISSVEINLVTNTAKVEFEQKKITIDELREAVKKACDESVIHLPLVSLKENDKKASAHEPQ